MPEKKTLEPLVPESPISSEIVHSAARSCISPSFCMLMLVEIKIPKVCPFVCHTIEKVSSLG